jgi:putative transposase
MPNHYHFLFRQDGDRSISEYMQVVFNSYVKAFNKRYHRTGALLEDRFKSVHVKSEAYLTHLCRYIHRNPIDANPPLVKVLEDWPYSNYPDFIGKWEGRLIDNEFMKEIFTNSELYKSFVHEAPSLKVVQRMEKMLLD